MCRICGSEQPTKTCCPNPLDGGKNYVTRDTFESLMYEVWNIDNHEQQIPYSIVRDFYSDWLSGTDIPANEYLILCSS